MSGKQPLVQQPWGPRETSDFGGTSHALVPGNFRDVFLPVNEATWPRWRSSAVLWNLKIVQKQHDVSTALLRPLNPPPPGPGYCAEVWLWSVYWVQEAYKQRSPDSIGGRREKGTVGEGSQRRGQSVTAPDMALNTCKCNYLTPLNFKGLTLLYP